jgi:hypothetical protein
MARYLNVKLPVNLLPRHCSYFCWEASKGFRPHTAILRISISVTNLETYRVEWTYPFW